jgi:hygromycin-B 4-O-kinase
MKPNITLEGVTEFLQGKYAGDVVVHPLIEGMESRALTYTAGGNQYVIRLNNDETGFLKDQRAYELFGAALPIPRVFEIGSFYGDYFYCISEWLPGETLEALSEQAVDAYLQPTYDLLIKIKDQPVEQVRGYGVFDPALKAPYQSWHAYLSALFDASIFDWKALESSGLHLEPFLEEYKRLMTYCPETRNLIHGDFGSNNVLVENGQISGVLDWDCAAVGDYLYDVAGAYYWSHHLTCMKKQAAYYESKLPEHEQHYQERIHCYQLRIGLIELYEAVTENDSPETVSWFLSRLHQL